VEWGIYWAPALAPLLRSVPAQVSRYFWVYFGWYPPRDYHGLSHHIPLINEVAVLLLVSLLGWKFTLIYIAVGMAVGMAGGAFLDRIKAERWLADFAADALRDGQQHQTDEIRQSTMAPHMLSQSDMPLLKRKLSPFLSVSGSGSFSE
jgi:hypothetical protein